MRTQAAAMGYRTTVFTKRYLSRGATKTFTRVNKFAFNAIGTLHESLVSHCQCSLGRGQYFISRSFIPRNDLIQKKDLVLKRRARLPADQCFKRNYYLFDRIFRKCRTPVKLIQWRISGHNLPVSIHY